MPATIDEQTTGSDWTDACTIAGVIDSGGGYYVVRSADVWAELQYGPPGQQQWTAQFPILYTVVGVGNLPPGCTGVRFKDKAPGTHATVTAVLAYHTEPAVGGGAGSPASAAPAGAVTSITGAIDSAGATVQGSGFSVALGGTGQYTITFATAFASPPTIELTSTATGVPVIPILVLWSTAGFTVNCFRTDDSTARASGFTFVAHTTV